MSTAMCGVTPIDDSEPLFQVTLKHDGCVWELEARTLDELVEIEERFPGATDVDVQLVRGAMRTDAQRGAK